MFGMHRSIFRKSGLGGSTLALAALSVMSLWAGSLRAQQGSAVSVLETNRRWYAGTATVDITPPADAKIWLSGYAGRKEPANGVEQPIHAKALVITQPGGEAIAFVTLDVIGVRRPVTRRISDRIETRYGIPRKGLVLFSSHTHCGPMLNDNLDKWEIYGIDGNTIQPNIDFTTELENKIVEAVGKAMASRRPVKLDYAEGKADFAVNRRESTSNGFKIGVNPSGPTDHSVPVLKISDMQADKPLAILFGYACHNTTLGADQLKICGDYAGYAQAEIEKQNPNTVAMFVAGCGGDQNPNPRGTVDLAKKHGETLGKAVSEALSSKTKPINGSLKALHSEPILHFAGPVDRYSYQSRLKNDGGPRDAHARRMINILAAGNVIDRFYPYPLQVIAFGNDLVMVAMGGEVVVDYSLAIKAKYANAKRSVWVSAYANDVFGYVPSTRILKEGGYEGGEAFYYSNLPTPLASDTERVILDEVRRMVDQLNEAPSASPAPTNIATPAAPNSPNIIDPTVPPEPPAAEVPGAAPEPATPSPETPAAVPAP